MLDYLRLDGTDLHDYVTGTGARDVARVEGLVGLAAPKGESNDAAGQHGSRNRNRFQSSKLVTIEGECWGNTVGDAWAQFDELVDAFERTLEDGAKLLTWRRANGGLQLQALAKLAGPVLPPLEEGAALLRYQAMVELMDPRGYSQTLSSAVGAALAAAGGGLVFPDAGGGLTFPIMFGESAGGIATVVNAGKVETPPVVRVYGPATSPYYVLDGDPTAGIVKLTGEIAAGDYMQVDHARKTVKLNGELLLMNLLDAPASRFFDVPKGSHEVRMFAPNFGGGAHIEVDTRDAYGG